MPSRPNSSGAPLDGFVTALGLLSVFPSGGNGLADNAGRRGVKWFSSVGVVIGAAVASVAALTYLALKRAGIDGVPASIVAGLAGTLADFLLTRGMHWDGLADVADAWWGGFDVSRRLEIMSDSAVGTFGIFAIVAAFAALGFGLAVIASVPWLLIPAYAISRLSGVFAAQLGRPAKDCGLGESVLAYGTPFAHGASAVTTWLIALGTCFVSTWVALAFLAPGLSYAFLISAIVSVVAAAVLPHLIALRMGGVTGDVIGASILLTQVVAILASAIALLAV